MMAVKTGLDIWHECNEERKSAEHESDYEAIFQKWVSLESLKQMTHDEIIEILHNN